MDESAFLSHLRHLDGARTFFEPLVGNYGDRLIRMGADHAVEKAGLQLVAAPDAAQELLINGNGAMNDVWWPTGLDALERLRGAHPGLPLTVGPSSYLFTKTDFPGVCRSGTAPLTLFCRELFSAQHLQTLELPDGVAVQVSQDLALELADSDWIRQLRTGASQRHVLVALRQDKEGTPDMVGRAHAPWLPSPIRRPLARLRDRLLARRVREDWLGPLVESEGLDAAVPRIFRDVAATGTFDDFVRSVQHAALVVTDRLHVGILGYLLQKRVLLRRGAYHKIRGVYELSLSGPDSRVTLLNG